MGNGALCVDRPHRLFSLVRQVGFQVGGQNPVPKPSTATNSTRRAAHAAEPSHFHMDFRRVRARPPGGGSVLPRGIPSTTPSTPDRHHRPSRTARPWPSSSLLFLSVAVTVGMIVLPLIGSGGGVGGGALKTEAKV